MTFFLAILEKYWLQILLALIVLGCYMYVTHLQDTVKEQEKEISTLTVQRDALQESNNKLVASIEVTNKAVGELQKLAPDTKKQFADLNTKVNGQSEVISAKVKRILSEAKPTSCMDTIKYLLDAQREYK